MIAAVGVILAAMASGAWASSPEDGNPIRSGAIWLDTTGKEIHAHGGGIYEEGGTYYWVGASKKYPPADLSDCVNLYSSTDLTTWTMLGCVFRNTSITGVPSPGKDGYRIERPKIIKCRSSGDYVMWFHLDSASFNLRMVGVASAKTITGPWTFESGFQPDGQASLDMGLYQDIDGSSWLVRSVNNQFAGISQLSSDCLNTTGIVSKGPRIEGQSIFRYNGKLYLIGSHLTGWSANPQELLVTDSQTLHGAEWTYLGNPSGDPTTFHSQDTFVLPYRHPDGRELAIYMGDRWNDKGPGGVPNATYIWLPFVPAGQPGPFGSSVLNFSWHDSWAIKDF